jgi:PKD repeat protein
MATPPNPVNVNQTVSFDASGSHEPAGACGTINSYTLNFGDGSPAVTQSTPTGGGFSHAYTAPGSYPATLTVKDTAGLMSNTVTDIITVTGTPPPLSSVLSVKTHGGASTFGVPLQKDATTQPRGVECRTGGSNGNHTIQFTFQNNLVGTIGTNPGSASVVLGPGSVVTTGTGIGPAQNQYTVNLTGVTNANYVSVALHNVSDTAGNIGDVATTMGVLVGDTNKDGFVDSADIAQTKSQSGIAVSGSNFREDLNIDDFIDSADITLVKSQSGTALPSTP